MFFIEKIFAMNFLIETPKEKVIPHKIWSRNKKKFSKNLFPIKIWIKKEILVMKRSPYRKQTPAALRAAVN